MRAFREIFGGLFLAVLAAATVIGGLWLAVTETSLGSLPTTAIAEVTVAATPTAFVPSQTAKPLPSNTATRAATNPPTPTDTATNTATASPEPSLTSTTAVLASATETLTVAPTATATATATNTATLAPTATTSTVASSPTVCAPPQGWAQYVVVQGDTLYQLSLRYGITQQQLQTANCLATPEIKYGQTLSVPFVASATAQEPTATATTIPTATPVPSPLQINGVTLVSVEADSSRPNGAIATIYINISGGAAPYTLYNDGAPQAGNPFPVLTECGGALLHTLRVLSADGQSVDYPYYYSPVNCP